MRHNHNQDHVIKRFLPWIFLLAIGGILYTLYAPYQLPTDIQPLHDTASNPQSLTQNTNEVPVHPPVTQNETPEKTPHITTQTTKETNSTESSSNQSTTTGTFVKHLHTINNTPNAWQTLNNTSINPVLLKQLKNIRKQLSAPFTVVDILYSDYERDGISYPENSKILAVRTNRWTLFSKENNGETNYYDGNGNAPELTMDRVPFAYTRITSPFNLRRIHPITHRIRPHEGVDLKGAYGTPIAATGNGIVTFANWKTGYGRIIIIDHENGYETRYAHLSAMSVNAGQRVRRGQIIGKLGNSGASTGAHLHYEVRINDTPYNPMTVKLPSYRPLTANELKNWQYYAHVYLENIQTMKAENTSDSH